VSVPAHGPHPLRKWERRYALTTEYLVKALYGKLIEKATRTAYEVPREVTAVVLDGPPCSTVAGFQTLSELPGGQALVLLPRYQAFTGASMALAQCGTTSARLRVMQR
jgi:hypothetical protein